MYSKKHFVLSLWASLMLLLFACNNANEARVNKGENEVIDFKVLPFDLSQVKLLDGPFKHATELNEDILLAYEPDRFLAKFRSEAGLEPKAEHYHGWEDNTIAGHSLGHYLTAICLMYESTGNEEFKKRANYIVDELYECQQADGDGYIGAFPDGKRILEEEVAKGKIEAQGFNLNGIWVPYYTQHKVMAGLNDAYYILGNKKALEINEKFSDWLATIVKDLNDEQIQEMLHCEHGGINESLAELYAITGKEKYIELSEVFHHKVILDSLSKGIDVLPGKHANTQIPKFVGLARRYELTGSESDHKGAVNFWNRMVHHHSYVTGGNGNHEYLGEPDKLSDRLSHNTTETCNVYNMLKLSEHLFEWNGNAEVMDYYERALFNHILSSQHNETGRVIYNLSIDMGGHKVYQDPHWFTCCVGTGMENHSKYGRNIFYHNNDALYVVQFIAAELNWSEKGMKVKQLTNFPESEKITYEIESQNPVDIDFKIRYPHWAHNGMKVSINGKNKNIKGSPGSFVSLGEKWKNGDKIEVEIPFSLRIETMPDNPKRIAVFNGPVVLAGILGPVPDEHANDPMYVPVLMTENTNPEAWLDPVDDNFNTFKTNGVGFPRDVELKPFYRTHDLHYTIFWDTYSDEEWKQFQEEYEAEKKRKRELEQKTIDLFRIGEMQPERDHNFKDEKSWVNEYKSKKYREADRSGWFSFEMSVVNDEPIALVCEYWGGYSGSKTFDIMVENEVIATENISNKAPGKFIDVHYDIPAKLINNKSKIEVKFVPLKGHRAGPVFTVRTIRK
ncbi:MAG: glycoside hydrolase family 127 protein [Prolixibacteraceae bacterium]|jgi:DUF1680 family protein|nr:glycoside hydrolase family 127 protein [Prolixibacteraceae bacterium]